MDALTIHDFLRRNKVSDGVTDKRSQPDEPKGLEVGEKLVVTAVTGAVLSARKRRRSGWKVRLVAYIEVDSTDPGDLAKKAALIASGDNAAIILATTGARIVSVSDYGRFAAASEE